MATASPGAHRAAPDDLASTLSVGMRVVVTANFKETQTGHLRAGQHATVHIDAYPGRTFGAHVDSIAEASGSRFSLLPPDNATGNYVKVVQRIPVLIRFDARPDVALRPGMSVEATVHTGT